MKANKHYCGILTKENQKYNKIYKKKSTAQMLFFALPGSVLLSQGKPLLPSALGSLTSVFGMGTGVTFPPSPPD